MSMALRNLATRMRSPAAAVLRPRVSPPPLRFRLFSSLEGRSGKCDKAVPRESSYT
uniref:Uncharacterized protein n=1 Tax=Aegilops tauschii subsp. strangulata TaxID=200361 RepID=A0A453QBV5_AEGTS